ncbi:MAG: DUF4157 domain-containing protein [Deltaproteobacteria bacterium]|nr:DUF4157 domain-containing protein [Deltaproteobacteria bacterium]MBW2254950.1 DUF4157 domain-containing protein [Deltaproteobacteria bacterium]
MKSRVRRRPSEGGEGSSKGKSKSKKTKKGGIGNAATADKIASKGMAGSGSEFPYLDKIQKSFGPDFDVSGARAHKGSKAKDATAALGATAVTRGKDVAFDGPADLFTAAHEMTHALLQGQGKGPSGGLGKSGDRHEKHADSVAQRVASGQSAAPMLAHMASPGASLGQSMGGSPGVQMRENPKKEVSPEAMARLGVAQAGIDHTKGVIENGAGNQAEALEATNFNSYFRMAAMRDPECWHIDSAVLPLARQYPDAMTAAKADLAGGGNCGEHAMIAFNYCMNNTKKDTVNRCDKEGLDHAFVILGNLSEGAEEDSELVVSDPWPTKATACLWEDHFAHTSDRKKLNVRNTVSSSDEDVKATIAKGLSLSAKGKAYIAHKWDDKKTQEEIKKGTSGDKPWIWQHADAASDKYDYHAKEPEKPAPEPEKEEPAKEEPSEQQDPAGSGFLAWLRRILGIG